MQLLVVAPQCCSMLTSSLICRRSCGKEIQEVNLNPDSEAPIIDVSIDGVLVPGV